MVTDFLRKGRENAIPSKELAVMCGYSTTRELQSEIAIERANGAVILSTTNGSGGYFLPATEEEVQRFIATLTNRAANTFAALKSAKAFLKQMQGQERMDGV